MNAAELLGVRNELLDQSIAAMRQGKLDHAAKLLAHADAITETLPPEAEALSLPGRPGTSP